jgi:hypothetical protein
LFGLASNFVQPANCGRLERRLSGIVRWKHNFHFYLDCVIATLNPANLLFSFLSYRINPKKRSPDGINYLPRLLVFEK